MKFSPTLFLCASLAVAAPAPQEEAPGHTMEFGSFSYGGSGCKDNTISHTLSEDGSLLHLNYDEMVAFSGPGFTIQDQRKFCNLNIELFVPHGWQ